MSALSWVYPRVCGGTSCTVAGRSSHLYATVYPRVCGGTCSPGIRQCSQRWQAVYPRVCGGTQNFIGVAALASGLSPRVRGNRVWESASRPGIGSIPACAGEPLSGRFAGCTCLKGRSIPACAGEPSAILPSCVGVIGVYPRVCGGTGGDQNAASPDGGLSPRVRGNPSVTWQFGNQNRSIPACAGEPLQAVVGPGVLGVYPRVCGGTYTHSLTHQCWPGLSPRVRGNHVVPVIRNSTTGSIPACAGEPPQNGRLSGSPSLSPSRVYPRVCGGTPV